MPTLRPIVACLLGSLLCPLDLLEQAEDQEKSH